MEKRHTDEVAVYFVNTDKICRLHQEFFDDPSTTDCISFPIDADQSFGYHVLGEIFICPKTAIDYVLKGGEEMNLFQKSARDELYDIVDEARKAKRDREEVNIGDNIADERPYEDRDKIMQGIRGEFWDRFNEECYRELTLYLVHGLLHLIGYDDIEDKDRALMREAEGRHMELLIRQKLLLFG